MLDSAFATDMRFAYNAKLIHLESFDDSEMPFDASIHSNKVINNLVNVILEFLAHVGSEFYIKDIIVLSLICELILKPVLIMVLLVNA